MPQEEKMVMFSKLAEQWQVTQSGEVKVCVLGLTMTTDSPKLLFLSVTCGLVSAALLSGISRAFLQRLWQQACHWCSAPKTCPDSPVKNTHEIAGPGRLSVAAKMGQKMTVITSVQLSTDPCERELDLLSSYEIVDMPRLRVRMRDAQTSPIADVWCRRDVGIGTGPVEVMERCCSPLSQTSMYESATADDLLLMFDGEEGDLLTKDDSNGPLHGDNTELSEKFGSMEKVLQEANQEMDSCMSTLSEISQRHLCSTAHIGRNYPSLIPFSSSTTTGPDGNISLTWEDEFTLPPDPPTSLPHPLEPFQPAATLDDLLLWQSDLNFYPGLSSRDTHVETSQTEPSSDGTRDSGCGDLWDTDLEPGDRSGEKRFFCVCGGEKVGDKRILPRPVSAPSGTGTVVARVSGAVSCDFATGESGCASTGTGAGGQGDGGLVSPDRVPKSKSTRKLV